MYGGRLKEFWFVYKGGKTNIFIIIKNVFLNISGGILCSGVLFKHVRGFVLGDILVLRQEGKIGVKKVAASC